MLIILLFPIQKLPTDKAYYIAKEFLMTERTYHKDLGIVINHFREYMALEEASAPTLSRLYETLQPLYSSHCRFLDELELRMSQCETRISESLTVDISDLICDHFNDLEVNTLIYALFVYSKQYFWLF